MMTQQEAIRQLHSERTAITYDIAKIVSEYTPFDPVTLTLRYLKKGVFGELLK